MLVTRTQQVALRGGHFPHWCHTAKNVYNKANYLVRQGFFGSGAYLSHYDVYHLIKHEEEYRSFPHRLQTRCCSACTRRGDAPARGVR